MTLLFLSFGIAKAQPILITSNLTLPAGAPHIATGDIIIANGATLTLASNAQLQMPAGAKIRVSTSPVGGNVVGSNLVLQPNSIITNIPPTPPASPQSWGGIEVWGQPNFSQLTTGGLQRQSRLVATNATIQNAFRAIYNYNNTDDFRGTQTAGGIIQVTGTQFINNGSSVWMQHYQNFSPFNTQIKWNDYSFFNNCTFTKNANIFTTWGQDIYLHHVSGVSIRGCQFNVPNTAMFSGTGTVGIRADNAGFSLDQFCSATGPSTPGTPCPTQSLIRSTFNNYPRSILGQGLLDFRKITIRNSDFNNSSRAIRLTGYVNPEITTNNFIKAFVNEETTIQVYLEGCTQFRIEENYIEQNPPSSFPSFSTNYGIIVNNSGQNYNEVYGNTVVNMGYHFQALNVNRWVSTPFNSIGLTYLCNNNSTGLNNAFDFTVDQTTAITPFGIAGNQGFVSTTSFGFDASRNTFDTKILPPTAWNHFRNEGVVLNYYRSSNSNEIPIYTKGINGVDAGGGLCESRWNNLPKDLNAALASLRDEISGYLQNGFDQAEPESEEFLRYQTAVTQLAFYTQVVVGQLGQDTAVNLNDYVNVLLTDGFNHHFEHTWMVGLLNQWANFYPSFGIDLINGYDYSNLATETGNEASLIATYLQIYNDLRAVNFADTALGYNLQNEVNTLMASGNYWAKALGHYYLAAYYNQFEPSEFVHYLGYSPRLGNEQLQAQKLGIAGLKAYPNPAENQLTLELPGEGLYKLVITDLSGKRLVEHAAVPAGLRQLDISTLPAGMYLLQVQAVNGEVQNMRIVKK